MKIPTWVELYAPLVARVLMGGMFLLAGLQKFSDLSGTATYIASAGLPAPAALAILAALLEVVFGGALLIGFRTKLAAAVLAAFSVVATICFHVDWSGNPMAQTLFIKNLAIVAGLLYMMTFGSGKFAADRK